MPPVSTTDYPRGTPLVETGSLLLTVPWDHFFQALATLAITVNAIPGTNLFTLAAQPTLGAGDAGYIGWVTDYGHAVRWTGAVWQFAPGDPGNGFWAVRPVAPQEVGWQLMDGTVTDYLTVGGATLTATPYTATNVPAGTFLKVLAAYTGVVASAVNTGTVGDAGASPDDMNLTSALLTAGAAPLAIASTSKFTHAHTPGAPASVGGLLYFRR